MRAAVHNPLPLSADRSLASLTSPTHGVNAALAETMAASTPPDRLLATPEAYVRGNLSLPASPKPRRARTLAIEGPSGPIGLRILLSDAVRGVYLQCDACSLFG